MKKGFTLAEVLITLVIIGVIAAMTIPTLINKTNEQKTVVAVKKAYSTVSQAYQKVIAENGEINVSELGNNDSEKTQKMGDMFAKHLSVAKNCGMSTDQDCFANGDYAYTNGDVITNINNDNNFYKIRLTNGMSVVIRSYNKLTLGNNTSLENVIGDINIDINGDKGPNQLGKDYFNNFISQTGLIVPTGTPNDNACHISLCHEFGQGCSAWVIMKGNMDYLRKDVSW